jgi:hypothetical protein
VLLASPLLYRSAKKKKEINRAYYYTSRTHIQKKPRFFQGDAYQKISQLKLKKDFTQRALFSSLSALKTHSRLPPPPPPLSERRRRRRRQRRRRR